jgi:hypothetical protein
VSSRSWPGGCSAARPRGSPDEAGPRTAPAVRGCVAPTTWKSGAGPAPAPLGRGGGAPDRGGAAVAGGAGAAGWRDPGAGGRGARRALVGSLFAALTWTHPVHGTVTEMLCVTHEHSARVSFAELGIDYTARRVADGPCDRCDGWRPWQRRRPGQPSDTPASLGGDARSPAGASWFQDGGDLPPLSAAEREPLADLGEARCTCGGGAPVRSVVDRDAWSFIAADALARPIIGICSRRRGRPRRRSGRGHRPDRSWIGHR